MAITLADRTKILQLIVGIFNAAPGEFYLNQIVQAFEAMPGTSAQKTLALAQNLMKTGAAQSIYPASMVGSEFAAAFLTPFGLQGNTSVSSWIAGRYDSGENKGTIIYDAMVKLVTTTDPAFATAKLILNNKVEVATYYSITLGLSDTDLVDLQAVLAGVNQNHSTVDAAIAAINFAVSAPTLSAADVTIAEGDAGTKTMVFTLTLNKAPTSDLIVNYVTADGTATAGSDYLAAAGSVTFLAGETAHTVSVTILSDTVYEAGGEAFTISFSSTGLLTSPVVADATITDEDPDPTTVTQTFVLTPGNDLGAAFTGGVGPDRFEGTDLTFNTGDHPNGGDNYDTLVLRLTAATAAKGHFTSIEGVVATAEADVTLDATFWDDVEDITNEGSTADLTVTNIQDLVDLHINGGNGSDSSFLFKDVLMTGDTTLNVTLEDADIGTLTLMGTGGSATENLNVDAVGDNTIDRLATDDVDLSTIATEAADLAAAQFAFDGAEDALVDANADAAAAATAAAAASADETEVFASFDPAGTDDAGNTAQNIAAAQAILDSLSLSDALTAAIQDYLDNTWNGSNEANVDADINAIRALATTAETNAANAAAGAAAAVVTAAAAVVTAQADLDAAQAAYDAAFAVAQSMASALENLVVTGTEGGSLMIGDSIGNALATVDASTYTGDLTLDVSGALGVTIDGALGDDDISLNADDLAGATIDLSTGDNILRVMQVADDSDLNAVAVDGDGVTFGDGSFANIQTVEFTDDVMLEGSSVTNLDVNNVGGLVTLAFAGDVVVDTTDDWSAQLNIIWEGDVHVDVGGDLTGDDVGGSYHYLNVFFDGGTAVDLDVAGDVDYVTLNSDTYTSLGLHVDGNIGDTYIYDADSEDDTLVTIDVSAENIWWLEVDDTMALDTVTASAEDFLSLGVYDTSATTVTVSAEDAFLYVDSGNENMSLIDMSGVTDFAYLDADGASFEPDLDLDPPVGVEVLLGSSDADLYFNVDDAARESITFADEDSIGEVTIYGFKTSVGGTGDRIDFSGTGSIEDIDDLQIEYDEGLDQTVITSLVDTDMLIIVVGANLEDDAYNFVF